MNVNGHFCIAQKKTTTKNKQTKKRRKERKNMKENRVEEEIHRLS